MAGLFAFLYGRRTARAVAPVIESMESRQLMSAGPVIINQQLVGYANYVTGIKLTFDKPVDPATAQDVNAYLVYRMIHTDAEDGGIFDAFVPFLDTSVKAGSHTGRLRLDSAVYDAATNSVTIVPHTPFHAGVNFRQLRVAAKGDHAIRGIDGMNLDGNGDGKLGDNARINFAAKNAKAFVVTDLDGDRATIRLKGPGKIVSVVRRKGQPKTTMLFLSGTNAAQSILSATIKPSRRGDGIVHLADLSGVSIANVTFLNNPQIAIDLVQ